MYNDIKINQVKRFCGIKMNTMNRSRIYFVLLLGFIFLMANGCKKILDTIPSPETGFVTDVDNNVYKTVKIGSHWWMAENLKVTKYRDGNYIPNVTDSTEWANKKSGAYCVYDPSNTNNKPPGLLYNWYVVTDSNNIAPAGWHIASDQEWKDLEIFLGMSQSDANKTNWRGTHEGEKLKVASPQGWTLYGNVWSTNKTSALKHLYKR